jgi:cytochrome P450
MIALFVAFFVAPIVALLAFFKSVGIGIWWKHKSKYPPYLQSFWYEGQEAGWIETIVGLTGNRAPYFVYDGFKRLPKGYPWIGRGKFPNKAISGCGYAVADIEIAKEILISPHSKKSIMYEGVDFLTCGYQNIFTANGHRWKHARKFVAPAFSSNHIKRMNRICAEHLETLIETKLNPLADSGKSFDVGKEMVCLTLSIISEAAFEYNMSREEMHHFTTNLETAADCFVIMNPLHQKFP